MTSRTTQIAIIGAGLAAHTAARAVAQAGASALMIARKSPGASALWSGLGQAFGPHSDFPSAAVGIFDHSAPLPATFRTSRTERFLALMHRRAFHPYTRLGLAREQVQTALIDALATLNYPGFSPILPEIALPSAAAAPFAADFTATSVAPSAIGRGERVGVVACPTLIDWYPERLVHTLNSIAPGADSSAPRAQVVRTAVFDTGAGGQFHAAIVADRLQAALQANPTALVDSLRQQVSAHDLDLLILPPCLGRTWDEHAEVFDALRNALPCRVAESAAAQNSIHGWRLDRWLRANNPVETISAFAYQVDVQAAAPLVHTTAGTVHADAVILATGRWVGSGLPAKPPFREPLLGADLWVDGAPMTKPDYHWPGDLLAEQPWQDHPLCRAGLATDAQLRPLGRSSNPIAPSVFAAGRLLAGFNPFWDGTTEGVTLISGLHAARSALHTLGIQAPTPSGARASGPGAPAQGDTP